MYGTQLAIHFMRKNKVPGGRIVATGSVAAIYPHESYPEYDGAKAAVSQYRIRQRKEFLLMWPGCAIRQRSVAHLENGMGTLGTRLRTAQAID